MTLTALLLLLLIATLIATLPVFRYSRSWGYLPSGVLAALLATLAVLMLL